MIVHGLADRRLRVALEDRIRERVEYRRWYRKHRFSHLAAVESANTIVLRELLALRREAGVGEGAQARLFHSAIRPLVGDETRGDCA